MRIGVWILAMMSSTHLLSARQDPKVRPAPVALTVRAPDLVAISDEPTVDEQPTPAYLVPVRPFDLRPLPLDEHPDLARMVSDLLEGARRRDPSLIAPWLADEIGGHETSTPRDAFVAEMRDWPEEEWAAFAQVLELGLAFMDEDGVSAIAPYVTEVVDLGEVGVVRDDAPMYSAPDASSAVTGAIGRAVLGYREDEHRFDAAEDGWYRVRFGDTVGYLSPSDTYQGGELRVYFERQADGWRLVSLGSGC